MFDVFTSNHEYFLQAWEAIHKNKSSSRAASPDKQEGKKKLTSESNRFTYSGELLPGRLSPFRRSRAAATGISPSRRPQSPFRGAKLLGDSKEAENYKFGKVKFHSGVLGTVQDVLSQGNKRTSYSGSLTLEKTLYVDTVSTAKLPSSNVSSFDNKRRVDTMVADLERRRGKESNSSLGSSQDIKQVQYAVEEKVTFDTEVLNSLDSIPPSLYKILNLTAKEGKTEGLTTDQNSSQEPESLSLLQGKFVEDSKINAQQIVSVNDSGKYADSVVSPLPPPLPKSPSESWLWRALPLVSVKNSFLHSSQGTQSPAKRHDCNATSGNLKWETIVKTSNLHHDHVRYSQVTLLILLSKFVYLNSGSAKKKIHI